jgi:hypothetical protein
MIWLLSQEYNQQAALTLVGNRFQLQKRQRAAIMRASCSNLRAATRRNRRIQVIGQSIAVDAFNLIITLEAAVSGAVLIASNDGLWRDLSSVHGNYRIVSETERAIATLAEQLEEAAQVCWYLDRAVSNSGRIASLLRELGYQAEVVNNADKAVLDSGWVCATNDGPLLDRATNAVDLTTPAVAGLTNVWALPLCAMEKQGHP